MMRKRPSFIVLNTHVNHYEVYKKGKIFSRKIAHATVNFEETKVTVHVLEKWAQYKNLLTVAVEEAHFLLKEKKEENKKEEAE